MADLRGGAPETTHSGDQILSISCRFWGKIGQIIAFHIHLRVATLPSGKSWIRHGGRGVSNEGTNNLMSSLVKILTGGSGVIPGTQPTVGPNSFMQFSAKIVGWRTALGSWCLLPLEILDSPLILIPLLVLLFLLERKRSTSGVTWDAGTSQRSSRRSGSSSPW